MLKRIFVLCALAMGLFAPLSHAQDTLVDRVGYRNTDTPPSLVEKSTGPTVIDVLFVLNAGTKAKIFADNGLDPTDTSLRTFVRVLADYANAAIKRSEGTYFYRVVAIETVNFNTTSDSTETGNRLLTDPAIAAFRVKYGADLVHLLSYQTYMNDNGEFTMVGFATGGCNDKVWGFSTSTPDAPIVAHELGHNLCQKHGVPPEVPNTGLNVQSMYGFVDQTKGLCDIMNAWSGCQIHIPYFSNPNVLYNGEPVGNDVMNAIAGANVTSTWVAAYLPKSASVCPLNDPEALCLGGRFRVEAAWTTKTANGTGQAVALTSNTGYFWFFDSSNVEVTIKVLDACGYNQKFWVFAAGMTDVAVTLTVTDTVTGTVKTYTNPLGLTFKTVTDTSAFATCS